ncbi:MAG: addiction module toxin, RelE/StbE family [Segetibacter sp.]|nr:addiction module toxin, RelE/StbE family [Segetibacter sp.]
MKKYKVVFSKVAAKELRHLPNNEVKRVITKSQELQSEPRPPGCKKLVGEKEDLWRVRVGDYRIIYSIEDAVFIIDIRRVGHRKDIYNK